MDDDPVKGSARRRPLVRLVLLIGFGGGLAAAGMTGCSDPRGAATSSAPADSAAGEIPFHLAGPGGAAIVVPVSINGRDSVQLILDTGATLTCVDTALVRELGLPERRGTLGFGVGIGASGRIRLHSVDSLRVGEAVARGIAVCAMDLRALRTIGSDVRGLLGLNVLRNFKVTLDFQRQVLRLSAPGSADERS